MPKLKTKKGVAKRFKLTKTGKIKYYGQNTGHLMTNKTSKRKRRLRRSQIMTGTKVKYLKRTLPYG